MQKKDDELNVGLTPEDDDLIFSPNEQDELLIEGENAPVQTPAEVVEEPITEPLEEESVVAEQSQPNPEGQVEEPKPTIEETLEPEVAEELTPESEKPSKKKPTKNKKETKKHDGSALPIVIILLLLLCIGVGGWYYYTNYYNKKAEPVKQEQKNEVPAAPVENVEVISEEPMVIDTVPPAAPVPPLPRIATKMKVPTTGWLIGYRALPLEHEAIKIVAELSYVDSLPCGYYWIPDVRKGGQKLFKIYVGPYNTKEEAEAVLPIVQAKRADAHIYTEMN